MYLGIDPGDSGGYALLDSNGRVLACEKFPETERDLWDAILEASYSAERAVIERVAPMPGQGVSGMFRFGMSYGMLRGFLVAARVPFEAVAPGVWCRSMGLVRKKGESQTAWKNRHKARAQELFPGQRITHAVADALLIAEWGRRVSLGA